jgi:hypothetical protein
MTPLSRNLTMLLCLLSTSLLAQVGEIKQRSSSHSSRGNESSSGGGSVGSAIFFDIAVQSLDFFYIWQKETLQKKESNPNITSVEVLLQTALQPATYYIVNPRVRANWGIFSTDFRMNYVIEEGIDGMKHIRTDDWQVVQLNIVTARNVTFRVGGGILHENFGRGETFGEGTVGVQVLSNDQRLGGTTEYRWSEPRRELNGSFHYRLFKHGGFSMYATAGAVVQTYYETVRVWGLQGGLMFRFN